MNRTDQVKTDLGRINQALQPYGVELYFIKEAIDDLARYNGAKRKEVYAHLVRRAKLGPLVKPEGIGEPLRSPLNGFAKIKPKSMGLRIIYRPRKIGQVSIHMEVLAIGPRDRDQVYKLAEKRLESFYEQMKI